jgi:hypothetical protein
MVNPRPGQPGNPGVTAVCADHQARAALSRRSRYSGDSVALAQQAVDGHPISTVTPAASGCAQQDRVEYRPAWRYRACAGFRRRRVPW